MKSSTLVACVVLSCVLVACNGLSLQQVKVVQPELIEPKNYDLLLNLLPLYGGIKLKYLITERSYEKIYVI